MGTTKEIDTPEEVFVHSLFTLNVWAMEGAIRKQIRKDRSTASQTYLTKDSSVNFVEEK